MQLLHWRILLEQAIHVALSLPCGSLGDMKRVNFSCVTSNDDVFVKSKFARQVLLFLLNIRQWLGLDRKFDWFCVYHF